MDLLDLELDLSGGENREEEAKRRAEAEEEGILKGLEILEALNKQKQKEQEQDVHQLDDDGYLGEDLIDDTEKKQIIVKYHSEDHFVSWYSECSNQDVIEMILCCCDCIMDSGFELLDSEGNTVMFDKLTQLKSGQTYHLYEGSQNQKFEKVLGDKWRKVKIEIEPLRHAEAQKAVEIMQMGANLLKHTKKGNPHMRQFQLSRDLKRIIWYTAKDIEKSQVDLQTVVNIKIGQDSASFKRFTLPMLEHLSFSVFYVKDKKELSLNITCKDEFEFDLWVTGLKALSYHFQNLFISKMELLSHSRQFNHNIENKRIGASTAGFHEENKAFTSKTLEDCINRKAVTQTDLKKKLKSLNIKINEVVDLVEELNDEMEHKEKSKVEGYSMVLSKESEADDVTLMSNRMNELLLGGRTTYNELHEKYHKAKNEGEIQLLDFKKMDADLWKVEIDLENIRDIIKRIKKLNEPTFKEKLKNLFPKFF